MRLSLGRDNRVKPAQRVLEFLIALIAIYITMRQYFSRVLIDSRNPWIVQVNVCPLISFNKRPHIINDTLSISTWWLNKTNRIHEYNVKKIYAHILYIIIFLYIKYYDIMKHMNIYNRAN